MSDSPQPMVVRYPWTDTFPDVVIHSPETAVKKHALYSKAKAGDMDAAIALITDTISHDAVALLAKLCAEEQPVLITVHAQEQEGVNVIPQTFGQSCVVGWGGPWNSR